MTRILLPALLALVVIASPLFAEDWTVDGKAYHNVVVGQVDADRVHITYDGGIGTVPLADLSPELQKRFNYDQAAAKAMTQQREQQAAQSDARVYAAQAQQDNQKVQDQNAQDAPPPSTWFDGTIVQIVPEGVLVKGFSVGPLPGRFAFLKHYGGSSAEGDVVHVKAYRDGVFTYTGTDGVQHQIAAYTPAGN